MKALFSLALLAGASCVPVTLRDAAAGAVLDASDDAPAPPADARIPGVFTRTWTDTTRGTPANGVAAATATRTLVTEVWYPALGVGGSPEIRDAPPDRTAAPFPTVLFVHGSSGTRRQSAFLTRALAIAGCVVAAADFPLTTFGTPGGSSDLHVDDQLGDLRFIADQLATTLGDPHEVLSGAVDPSRYLVVGHSTGGTVALLAAYAPDLHDRRVAGVAALAPCACFFADAFFATRPIPLLVIAGTDDHFVPIATNGARAYALALPPRDFVTLVGGNHLYFTDLRVSDDALMPNPTTAHDAIAAALARYSGGTACEPIPPAGSDPLMAFDVQHRHTVQWVTAFAESVLRGRANPLAALRTVADPGLVVMHSP